MDFSSDINALQILLALLPGFLTAQVVDVLVVREERTPLERVIQALIFTFLAHVLWYLLQLFPLFSSIGDLVGLALTALLWGLGITWMINSGAVHGCLRKLKLTQAASRPSEWYDAFYDRQRHIILHLKDGRRIFGWPRIYPFRSDKGHLLVEGAEWLDRSDGATDVPRVDLLVDVNDIRFVEFLPPRVKEDHRARTEKE